MARRTSVISVSYEALDRVDWLLGQGRVSEARKELAHIMDYVTRDKLRYAEQVAYKHMVEASLSGDDEAARKWRDAWSLAKEQRQAISAYFPPKQPTSDSE